MPLLCTAYSIEHVASGAPIPIPSTFSPSDPELRIRLSQMPTPNCLRCPHLSGSPPVGLGTTRPSMDLSYTDSTLISLQVTQMRVRILIGNVLLFK